MTRSAAIAAAIATELAAHQDLLNATDGPNIINLMVKLGQDGLPYAVMFRSEWDKRVSRRLTQVRRPA